MNDNRVAFLEQQINFYHEIINDLDSSKINRKQKKELQNLKELYKQYIFEYKEILIAENR